MGQLEKNNELKNQENMASNTETNYIKNINQSLKQFEIYLKTIDNENGYYLAFPIGRTTCELMLKLLLQKENRQINDCTSFLQIIKECEEKSLIPKKCVEILHIIRLYNLEYIHGIIPTYQKTYTFLNSFNYFIKWFDDNFKKQGIENQFRINACNELIQSLHVPNEINFKSKPKNISESQFNEEKTHYISKNDELYEIEHINELIVSFEKQLTYQMELSSSIIITASSICELILKFLLKRDGYDAKRSFFDMIRTSYANKIIPYECYKFLNIIRRYRNKTVHSMEPSDEFILNFLKAFNFFIIWFNEYYSTDNDIQNVKKVIRIEIEEKESQEIENLRKEVQIKDDLYKNEKNKNKKLSQENKKLENEKRNFYKKFDLVLEKLDQSIEIQEETNENTHRIESKVDKINQNLLLIKEDISSIQTETSKLLKTAKSLEKEEIFEWHMNKCKDNIINKMKNINETEKYEIEKTELNRIFEDSAWNKLSDKSKTFLITSKIMFNQFNKMEDIIDYSGICILVTKALEVEIKKRFFTNFLKYLDKNYHKDYSKYPTSLLYRNKTPLFSNKFTMGKIAHILCYEKRYYNSRQQYNNKEKLIEYCKSCIFSTLNEKEIEDLLYYYAESIEKIKDKYRNRSAHTDKLKKKEAKQCLNLIIDVNKLLKKMLDSFDI